MEKNRKILVLGASELQIPLIDKVKNRGFDLAVVDLDKNAVGVGKADIFYEVSTTDEEGVYRVAKEFGADAIVTMATDLPIRSIAYASKKLNIKAIDYDTALSATDKALMIDKLRENNVPHPRYMVYTKEDFENGKIIDFELPCIVKPTDSSGSRGVSLVKTKEELVDAINYSMSFSRGGNIIVEEYMRGSEVSVEVLCIGNEPNVVAITDKLTTGAPYFVELGHSQPSMLGDETTRAIEVVAKKACRALNLYNSAAHVEIIVTESGPKIVELGARLGGDFITSHLVPLSTGNDIVDMMLMLALDEKIDIDRNNVSGACIRYFKNSEGIINSIQGIEEASNIDGVEHIKLYNKIGDKIGIIHNSRDRIGYVITKGENAKDAITTAEEVISKIKIGVE